MTFLDAAKLILSENGNKPMTCNEIWNIISERNLVKTGGKTPRQSLLVVLLSDSVDSPIKNNKTRNYFLIVDKNPMKFILNNYMPNNIRESLIRNGFITIEALKEIFKRNNINIEI